MNLQLSIIVPVYNVEKYLHRCMESLLAQNIPDYEIILVDDLLSGKRGCRYSCETY